MTTGERIKSLRQSQHMTQQQLADRLKATKQAVSIWENDKQGISREMLEMLCDIFNVSMDYLTGREDYCPQVLTLEEMSVVNAYRNLSDDNKDMICKMLDVKRGAEFISSQTA